MPTFADGESGASVRTKINDAITAVEGMIESGSNSNGYCEYDGGDQEIWSSPLCFRSGAAGGRFLY